MPPRWPICACVARIDSSMPTGGLISKVLVEQAPRFSVSVLGCLDALQVLLGKTPELWERGQ